MHYQTFFDVSQNGFTGWYPAPLDGALGIFLIWKTLRAEEEDFGFKTFVGGFLMYDGMERRRLPGQYWP